MTEPLPERVAGEVRAEMGRQRLNQRQIAEALGITQGAVWKKLDGRTPFRLAELETLADLFQVPVVQLLGDGTGPTGPTPTGPGPSGPSQPAPPREEAAA